MQILTRGRDIPRHRGFEADWPSPWVIVLAGGKGERMRPTILRWLGEDRPKQFCVFVGTRSMLQHTLDRASILTTANRIVIVIRRGQEPFLSQAIAPAFRGTILSQPTDCGTAVAIYHALAHVLEQDPAADVVILPADHYVHPDHLFIEHIRRACESIQSRSDRLILLGAPPTEADADYGWILPDQSPSAGLSREDGLIWPILCLQEKPEPDRAVEFYRHGSLLSTMIAVAKAQTLWNLGKRHLPQMTEAFETYRHVLRAVNRGEVGGEHAALVVGHVYSKLKPTDFSRDFLARATKSSVVLPLRGVQWCDWGRPERIEESLTRLSARPAYLSGSENGEDRAPTPRHGIPS